MSASGLVFPILPPLLLHGGGPLPWGPQKRNVKFPHLGGTCLDQKQLAGVKDGSIHFSHGESLGWQKSREIICDILLSFESGFWGEGGRVVVNPLKKI